jgi:plastocyanin
MTGTRTRAAVAIGALAVWAALAGATTAADSGVTIADFSFSPGTITVKAGDTVTWTNNDTVDHTATGGDFDAGTIEPGATATVTFKTAGSFTYACKFHPTMTGTVVVQAAASGGGGSGGGGASLPPTDALPDASPSGTGAVSLGALALLASLGVLGGIAMTRRLSARER